MTDIKLGAAFANTNIGTDFGAIRDIVQSIEDTGFDNLATNDHVVGGHPDRAGGERMHTSVTSPTGANGSRNRSRSCVATGPRNW